MLTKEKRQTFFQNTEKTYFHFLELYESFIKHTIEDEFQATTLRNFLQENLSPHFEFLLFSDDKSILFSTQRAGLNNMVFSVDDDILPKLELPLTYFSFDFNRDGRKYFVGVKKNIINGSIYHSCIISEITESYREWILYVSLWFLVFLLGWSLVYYFIVTYLDKKKTIEKHNSKRHDNRFFDIFLHNNHTLSMLLDENFNIVAVSKGLLSLLNYYEEQLLGKPITDYILDLNLPEHVFISNVHHNDMYHEVQLLDNNSRRLTCLISNFQYFDEREKHKRTLLIFHNIESAVNAITRLKYEQIKNEFFIKLSHVLVNNEDISAIFEFVAKEAKRFVDYDFLTLYIIEGNLLVSHYTNDPEFKVRGKNLTSHMGSGLSGTVAKIRRSMTINDTRHSHIAQRVEGTSESDECLMSVPLLSKNNIYGVLTVSRQSLKYFVESDQKNLEVVAGFVALIFEKSLLIDKLTISEDRFLSVINESSMGVVILQSNKIAFTNRKMRDFLDYSEKYLLGKDIFLFIEDSFKVLFTAQLTSYHLKTDLGIIEVAFKNSENALVHLELSFASVDYKDQNSILITANNITKTIELNKHLQQAQKLESLGALTSGIAHDFKNILAGIMGAADLLMIKSDEESSAYHYAKVIKSSANRGAGLSLQLLNFSSTRTQEEIIDINELLQETIQIIKYTFNKNILIDFNLAIEPLFFEGDLVKVQQCILNLCVNARDAMPNGGTLTIKTSFVNDFEQIQKNWSEAVNRAYNLIEITDTGSGIPEDKQSKIFDSFFTTKEKSKGTGLGLSTTKSIILEYDGHITFKSKLGKGTTFFVYLPWVEKEEPISDFNFGAPKNVAHTILLVDDELIVLDVAKELLEELGCTVYATDNGFEALELLHQHPEINIALIDRIMPKMDGFTLLKKIKEKKPETIVIFASGFIQESDIKEIKANGAHDYILKPYKLEELITLLNSV
jgi:PAS domain S-box-containing protein